jgi:hypothetical protein
MSHPLGPARVSTTDQQPQLQLDALQRASCYRVFTETASGARTDRNLPPPGPRRRLTNSPLDRRRWRLPVKAITADP